MALSCYILVASTSYVLMLMIVDVLVHAHASTKFHHCRCSTTLPKSTPSPMSHMILRTSWPSSSLRSGGLRRRRRTCASRSRSGMSASCPSSQDARSTAPPSCARPSKAPSRPFDRQSMCRLSSSPSCPSRLPLSSCGLSHTGASPPPDHMRQCPHGRPTAHNRHRRLVSQHRHQHAPSPWSRKCRLRSRTVGPSQPAGH